MADGSDANDGFLPSPSNLYTMFCTDDGDFGLEQLRSVLNSLGTAVPNDDDLHTMLVQLDVDGTGSRTCCSRRGQPRGPFLPLALLYTCADSLSHSLSLSLCLYRSSCRGWGGFGERFCNRDAAISAGAPAAHPQVRHPPHLLNSTGLGSRPLHNPGPGGDMQPAAEPGEASDPPHKQFRSGPFR
jgi:hypothetical protein